MPVAKLKCKYCKEYYQREQMIKVNAGNFCCDDHLLKFALDKNNQKKAKAKIKMEESRELKKKKAEVRPISHDLGLTQKAFNKMRVLEEKAWFKSRGLEPECISCGKKHMDWCCGHLKTRGSQSGLRFDRNNTFLQCNRYCNMGLSGNINGDKNTRGYIQGLKDRFGVDKALQILDYCSMHTEPKKWTKEELKEMRKEFSAESRRLQLILAS